MADEERMGPEDDTEGQYRKVAPDEPEGADDVEGAKRKIVALEDEESEDDDTEGHKASKKGA